MRVFAGCDGGGTKCTVRVALCDDVKRMDQCSEVRSGPANVKSDPDAALSNILAATAAAMTHLRLDGTEIEHFVLALAGAGTRSVQQRWEHTLSDQLNVQRVSVVADAAALFAATEIGGRLPVIATVVGTGSIVWAKTSNGEIIRAGGHGPLTSDEGSAYWIGTQAVNRLQGLGVGEETKRGIHSTAALAPRVFSSDDVEAKKIVAEAAAHISKLVLTAGHGIDSSPDNSIPWLCAGGVAVNNRNWLETIRARCADYGLCLASPVSIQSPVMGAVNLAMQGLDQ